MTQLQVTFEVFNYHLDMFGVDMGYRNDQALWCGVETNLTLHFCRWQPWGAEAAATPHLAGLGPVDTVSEVTCHVSKGSTASRVQSVRHCRSREKSPSPQHYHKPHYLAAAAPLQCYSSLDLGQEYRDLYRPRTHTAATAGTRSESLDRACFV